MIPAALPITVAILTRNEESRIERCLRSLEVSGAAEILVIDNGSTDATLDKVAAFREREFGPPIRMVHSGANHLGRSRQKAAELAGFSWIAFLDADCVAPEGWLRGLYESFQRRGGAKLLAAGSGNFSPASGSDFHRALRLMLASPLGHFGSLQARLLASAREVSHLPTCNVLYHRDRLLEAGGFSRDFEFVCEDLELSVRARKQGWRLLYAPGWEVEHDHRASTGDWARKMFRYGRGQVLVFRKHKKHALGMKSLPFLFGAFFVISAVAKPALFCAGIAAYAAGIVAVSLWLACRGQQPRLAPKIAVLLAVTHWGYAFGELAQAGISLFAATRQVLGSVGQQQDAKV